MLEMKIERLAEQIVRHHLLGQGRKKEALYLNFDLRLSSNRFDQSRGLHLLYHQIPDCASVSVFSAMTLSPFGRIGEITSWEHDVSHDSCWRDIGIFSSIYFEMAELINEKRTSYGLVPFAPAEMTQWNSFVFSSNSLFQWVPVNVSKDAEDMNNYRRLIQVHQI